MLSERVDVRVQPKTILANRERDERITVRTASEAKDAVLVNADFGMRIATGRGTRGDAWPPGAAPFF